MILVDTNVAIDALDSRAADNSWAATALADAIEQGAFITPIVVAELAVRIATRDQLAALLAALALPVDPIDTDTAYLAGQAFAAWIEAGGRRGVMLPDLLIGAHAMARGAAILTRDVRRFRRYFPDVTLITPESQP